MHDITPLATLVTPAFHTLAAKHNMTPEHMLGLAAQYWLTLSPTALQIESAVPLNTQQCADCLLLAKCSSSTRRDRENLICFERLSQAAVPV